MGRQSTNILSSVIEERRLNSFGGYRGRVTCYNESGRKRLYNVTSDILRLFYADAMDDADRMKADLLNGVLCT